MKKFTVDMKIIHKNFNKSYKIKAESRDHAQEEAVCMAHEEFPKMCDFEIYEIIEGQS